MHSFPNVPRIEASQDSPWIHGHAIPRQPEEVAVAGHEINGSRHHGKDPASTTMHHQAVSGSPDSLGVPSVIECHLLRDLSGPACETRQVHRLYFGFPTMPSTNQSKLDI